MNSLSHQIISFSNCMLDAYCATDINKKYMNKVALVPKCLLSLFPPPGPGFLLFLAHSPVLSTQKMLVIENMIEAIFQAQPHSLLPQSFPLWVWGKVHPLASASFFRALSPKEAMLWALDRTVNRKEPGYTIQYPHSKLEGDLTWSHCFPDYKTMKQSLPSSPSPTCSLG